MEFFRVQAHSTLTFSNFVEVGAEQKFTMGSVVHSPANYTKHYLQKARL